MNRRISSFTLIEVLIAMVLSVLVIGFSLQVFSYFKKQYSWIKLQTDSILEINRFEFAMNSDFESSRFIHYQNNQLLMDGVSYHFGSEIVRTSFGFVDTFNLRVIALSHDQIPPLLTQLNVETTLVSDTIFISFFKEYDAQTIMKYEKK